MRCLDESWALEEESDRHDCGSPAEAGLEFGGAQAIQRAPTAPSVSAIGDDGG